MEIPFKDLKEDIKKIILYGNNKKKIKFEYTSFRGTYLIERTFEGVITSLQIKWFKKENEYYRDEVSKYLISLGLICEVVKFELCNLKKNPCTGSSITKRYK